jgi:peptidoglycan/xylan/chitin deacetylase (PgdA/CDA1 family)
MRVALTFDAEHPDRPTRPGVVESIVDTLARESVRATFFLQGRWVEAYPPMARKIARAGHTIGNHSHYHARMPLLNDPGFRTDVRTAERIIKRVCGVDPRPWFRCPFDAGADESRTHDELQRLGYRQIGWNVTANDWHVRRSPTQMAADVVTAVTDVTSDGDAAIVLLHSWPRATGRALPTIVNELRDRGATFVGVEDIFA